jgi:hypothetical protein
LRLAAFVPASAQVFERHAINPGMPFAGIIAAAALEMLEKAYHACPAESFLQRLQTAALNLIGRHSHLPPPEANREGF